MKDFKETKTLIDFKHSPWGGYTGQSVGRVIHYLYHYLGYNYAEESVIGIDNVRVYNKVIAKINWDKGFPIFEWTDELSEDMRSKGYKEQFSILCHQPEFEELMDNFERVMNKALEYAEKDTIFPHNKNHLKDIQKKYFKK